MKFKAKRSLAFVLIAGCGGTIFSIFLPDMELKYKAYTDNDTTKGEQHDTQPVWSLKSLTKGYQFEKPLIYSVDNRSRVSETRMFENSQGTNDTQIGNETTKAKHLQGIHLTKNINDNVRVKKSNKDNDQHDTLVGHENIQNKSSFIYKSTGNAVKNTTDSPKPSHVNYNDRKFFTLRKDKVNAFEFDYLTIGNNICKDDEDVFMVILCLSTYGDSVTRDTIRKTWGSVAKTHRWPAYNGTLKGIKLVFLLGDYGDQIEKKKHIEVESNHYNDIIAANFIDSYYNLTYKVMLGLKWSLEFCKQARHVVKIDQDMFLHVRNLVTYLNSLPVTNKGGVVGYIFDRAPVLRSGRWGVPVDVFPFKMYPAYVSGNCYVISGSAVSQIYEAAERLPFISIEDTFFTGMCRTAKALPITHHGGFARWTDPDPRSCGFHNTYRIAATNVSDKRKLSLWRSLTRTDVNNC